MKKDTMEEEATDIFLEMGNIGTGSAVTALSNMIGRPINEIFPNVMLLDYERQACRSMGNRSEIRCQ